MARKEKTAKEGINGTPHNESRTWPESQGPTSMQGGLAQASIGDMALEVQIAQGEPTCNGSWEGTQSLDFSGLFSKHVSSSGSFRIQRIGATLLGKMLEALPIPALLIDRSGHITFVNQACGRIDGRYEGILGKSFYSLFPDRTSAQQVESVLVSVLSTRIPRCHTAWLQINNGRIWGRVTLRSVRMRQDRFSLALVEDLTGEKRQLLQEQKWNTDLREVIARLHQAEKKQRQTEHRFELALKGADLGWWDWDVETDSLVSDESFIGMLGYAADEITPKKSSWERIIHPDDAPRFSKALKAHFNNLTPHFEVEHRLRCKSGRWKWILTRGRIVERGDEGQPLRASGTNLDITAAKEAQERIDSLTHSMIRAQERERERIALDLHDQVAQELSALRLSLQALFDDVRSVKPKLGDRVAEVSETVRGIVRDVRDLSYELLPPGLDELGLVSTVQQYCREFSLKNGLAVEFLSEGIAGLQLDFDTQINLFRVIQEALNNSAKHADAAKAIVRLKRYQARISLTIEDDGKGFEVERESAAARTNKRMGLWCMEQRAGLLGGKIVVASNPARGTEISVEVPLWRGENDWKKRGSDRR